MKNTLKVRDLGPVQKCPENLLHGQLTAALGDIGKQTVEFTKLGRLKAAEYFS